MKRTPYLTENRIIIINFCKANNRNINKAQIMNLLNCSCDSAYDIYKSMLKCGINGCYSKIPKYEKAKEKVLFENYSVIKKKTYSVVIDSHGRNVWLSWNQSKTIESLINEVTEVSLTPNSIKRIFG
jgi:hypothetical protein